MAARSTDPATTARSRVGDAPLTKIALVLNKDLVRCRGILRGILQYVQSSCPNWILHTVASLSPSRIALLKQWSPHGFIAELATREEEALLARFGVPIVSVSNVYAGSRCPQVVVDQQAIGVAVARHLLEHQLRHFGYIGPPGRQDAVLQRRGFAEEIARAGGTLHPPSPIPSGPNGDWTSMDRQMTDWLVSLPRPCGVMLWDDDWGLWITQLCRVANLRVPDDVALVGVNDDQLNCTLAEPALSAVGIPLQRVGQRAAALLQSLFAKRGRRDRATPPPPMLVDHLGVTARPSSDILAIDDADVVAAVRFIRSNAHARISVSDILRAVPVSRRILERKFRKHLNRTPLQQIRHTQIELAEHQLATTDFPLKEIARRIGFDNIYHLCRTFKRRTGVTPMQYRKKFRAR